MSSQEPQDPSMSRAEALQRGFVLTVDPAVMRAPANELGRLARTREVIVIMGAETEPGDDFIERLALKVQLPPDVVRYFLGKDAPPPLPIPDMVRYFLGKDAPPPLPIPGGAMDYGTVKEIREDRAVRVQDAGRLDGVARVEIQPTLYNYPLAGSVRLDVVGARDLMDALRRFLDVAAARDPATLARKRHAEATDTPIVYGRAAHSCGGGLRVEAVPGAPVREPRITLLRDGDCFGPMQFTQPQAVELVTALQAFIVDLVDPRVAAHEGAQVPSDRTRLQAAWRELDVLRARVTELEGTQRAEPRASDPCPYCTVRHLDLGDGAFAVSSPVTAGALAELLRTRATVRFLRPVLFGCAEALHALGLAEHGRVVHEIAEVMG